MPQRKAQRCQPQHHRRGDEAPANAGYEQEDPAHAGHEKGRPAIRFDEDQTQHHPNEQRGDHDAPLPARHLALVMFPIPGQRDDQRQLRQFGRLKADDPEAEPAPRPVDERAQVFDQNQTQ